MNAYRNAHRDWTWGDVVVWGGTPFSGTFEERPAPASAGGLSSVLIAPPATPLLYGASQSGKRKADHER